MDPLDPTTLDEPVDDCYAALQAASTRSLQASADLPLAGVTLGTPAEYFAEGMDASVRDRVDEALDVCRSLGARTVEVGLPHTPYAVATYYLVAPAEASANLARYDGLRYGIATQEGELWERVTATRGAGFGPEVKRRIMLGTYALSSGYQDRYYGQASRVRTLIQKDFETALSECDVLVGPTTPEVAFPLGSRVEDPLAMYLSDTYTIGPSLAGCPAVSVPCGLAGGLPVGLQFVGSRLGESRLLEVAFAFESATGFSEQRPPLALDYR
jgi:aspartyl-tRNA(Asn)/glutamyl-tRNA(Gln) amidotransferase subunit A